MGLETESSDQDTGCWNMLPEHLLVSVMLYLSPNERLQMALTCRAWSTCLQHPLLWQRFVCQFLLPQHEKVLAAIRTHGHRIRSLVVKIDQQDTTNRLSACQVLNFLAKTRERKLSSITVQFVGQNPLFYAGHEFFTELKLLFGHCGEEAQPYSQLTHVDLSALDIAFDDSLFDLLANNHPLLSSLNIQNKSLVCKVSPRCMLHLVSSCKKLRELSVFHLSLTDDVLNEIAQQEEPCLQFLSILYRRETKYTVDLSSEAWSSLVKKLPSLRVTLGFDHTCPLNRICEVMKAEIPVTELRLETFTRIYEEVNHATDCYHRSLQKLVLHTRNSEELGKALIRAAANCNQLHTLLVYCVLSQSVIDQILHLCPEMRRQGSYILKSTMEEGPWVVGAETNEEAQEKLNST